MNGTRIVGLTRSTQADTADTLKTVGSQHGTSANLLRSSETNINNVITLRGTYVNDNVKQKDAQTAAENGIINAREADISKERREKDDKIKENKKTASNAGQSAETARLAQGPMPQKIAERIRERDRTMVITPETIRLQREAAANSAEVANDQNIKRQDTNGPKEKQISTRNGFDSSRKGAADDIVKYTGGADAANRTKIANENALGTLQKNHNEQVAKMKSDADGEVSDLNKKLDVDMAAATGPRTQEKANAKKAREDKEGEIKPNSDAIKEKGTEIGRAQGHEANAKGDLDKKNQDISDIKGTLDIRNSTAASAKTSRDEALDTANKNTPVRTASEQANAVRRSDIINKDIPDQKAIKTPAERGISDANTSISTANRSKEANNTELNPMGPVRRDRVEEDTKLRDRSTDAKNANGAAHKSKKDAVADVNTKQGVLQRKRQHMDDIDSIITTRSLKEKTGVPIITDASLTVLVTSNRHSASTAGVSSGKKHAESAAGLTKTNDNLTGVNDTLKKTGADQERLGGIKDDMVKSIPREKANADILDAKRKEIPDKIIRDRAQADIASGKIRENLTGIEGAGSELDMANDAFQYFNEPLLPTQALINKNTNLGNAAGSTAAKHRDVFNGAGDSASKARNSQQNADAGRKQSAKDIVSHNAGYDASVKRKTDSETALTNVQKKHQDDMDAMKANANDTVIKNKRDLEGATETAAVLDPLAAAATKKRRDKDAEATTQGATTASKLGEVNTARGHEANAKKASDDAAKDVADKQDKLTGLTNSEPGLKSDRETARSTAEAAKPVRDPADAINKKRQETLQSTEIPAATSASNRAKRDSDDAAESLRGKGGLNEKRAAGENDLNSIKNTRKDLDSKDTNLTGRRGKEGENLTKLKESRDGVDSKIMDGNKSIQKASNHSDDINNIIGSKKLAGEPAAPPQSMSNIASKQTTSGNTMTSNGKKHAMSEGALNASIQHTGRIRDKIKDLEGTGADISKKRDKAEGDLSAEKTNRNARKADVDDTVKQIDGLKKNADDASKSADDAMISQDEVRGRPGGIDDMEYYAGLTSDGISAKQAKINKNKKGADDAGATAADANSGRNTSASNAQKIRGELEGHNAKRKAENENASGHQAQADAARARNIKNEANLDNVKKVHNDSVSKMQNDGDSAATKHKKDLDDATGAASAQYDASTAAAQKRKNSEQDSAANGTDISKKREDVDKARDNELAAKQKRDTDAATTAQHQKDLDTLKPQEAPLKKDRDDAGDAANGALPERSPSDSAKKKRQEDIGGEVDVVQKQKNDAEAGVAMAKDGAARAKAKKDGLPDPEDTKPLRDKEDELEDKKKKEEENRDELEGESKKNKKKIEDGEVKMALRQNMVGMISGLMTNMLSTNLLPDSYSAGPVMGQFMYPIPKATASGSVASTTSGPVLAGFVTDTSGNPQIVTAPVDISGMGDFAEIGPSGAGPSGAAEYTVNYEKGKEVGTQDGTRDATSDATDAYSNKKDKTLLELQEKIGMLSIAKQSAIDAEITRQSQEAYCKKVEDEGKAKKLDVYKVFSECSKHFEKTMPRASQPMLEKLGPSISEESGAQESGAQEGGYREDLSGVMQFGGELTNSGPVPTEENDAAYMAGYQAGYKKAYTQTYSLTIAIKITQQASFENELMVSAAKVGYGEAVEQVISSSMPVTEASARAPKNETGAVSEIKKRKPKSSVTEATSKNATGTVSEIKSSAPVTEAAAKPATNATGAVSEIKIDNPKPPVTEASSKALTEAAAEMTLATGAAQGGGFLKLAKRNYKRGKTLTQHGRLLNKIKDKTSVV